jgi:acyl carrier protein
MTLEDFAQKFAGCFNQTSTSSIKPETEFKKLEEWGSMMALIVIAMIDADFGKTISSEDLKKATTVSSLYEIVKNR